MAKQQWEYHVQVVDKVETANLHTGPYWSTLGSMGWELVGIMQPLPAVHGVWDYRLIFKRERVW